MKKNEVIANFFIGGCIGKTLMEISGMITNLFIGTNTKETISQLKVLMITFIIGGIVYIIAKMSIRKIEKKDMKSKDRQKLLKRQMLITAGGIILFSICLIIYMLNKNYIGAILALSFGTVFSFWGYGFLLSYINLKNNMVMITKKDVKI